MLPRLHLVTDAPTLNAPRFAGRAEAVLHAHGPAIALHLRGHGLPGRTLHALAIRLVAVARDAGAVLFVNDRVDVALAVRPDGVQLGPRSLTVDTARALLPEAIIGYSAHGADEAAAVDADFVLLGTIFESPTHAGIEAAGVARIEETARRTARPIVAIGGVTPERVARVFDAGAYGIAVLSGVWSTSDPAARTREYIDALVAVVPGLA